MRFSPVIFPLSFAVATVSAGTIDRRAVFTLDNGKAAQALNRKFQGLTADSPCSSGETACVGSQLAQCVGGKFALSQCSATLQCVALPLVNKPGTRYVCTSSFLDSSDMHNSVTCDTPADAQARIAATGVDGGLTGNPGSGLASRAVFTLGNGQAAQALNRKFQGLSADAACTSGETACVGDKLAQCVGGKFALSDCSATLRCVALPLVNKAGTRYVVVVSLLASEMNCGMCSVTCDTTADAEARIAATGAKGGIEGTGNAKRYVRHPIHHAARRR